jgi:2-hydroxy-3-keto-5-methylthiopentenyl-1-phosphate phosphatase
MNKDNFIFYDRWCSFYRIEMDRSFFSITKYDEWNIKEIIDLREKNLKIQEEFKDLFEWLKLQEESFIKLKKFMKTSLIEMYDAQKQVASGNI